MVLKAYFQLSQSIITVKSPKRGHFGNGPFDLCSEVVPFLEVYVLS